MAQGFPASQAAVVQTSEGRWPRICERPMFPATQRVAMLSMHTSPLAPVGRLRDAGGMNVYIRELAQHLGRTGIAVDIFTRWTDPSLPQIIPLGAHARVIHIPAGPIASVSKNALLEHVPSFVAGIDCFAISQRVEYDIIHSHYWLSGVAGMELAHRWGAPHLTMFHTLARLKMHARPEERETALRMEHEWRVLRASDVVVVATQDEREQIARLYGTPPSRVQAIPCGVDLATFTPESRSRDRVRIRHTLRMGMDDALLLAVGRLDPLKGPELLIRMLPHLRAGATLALVGGDAADPERARLRTLADTLGVRGSVRFVDAVPHEELPKWYRAADLFVMGSHYESFGLVAVEALACGTPVVAPRVGGLQVIVRDGVNGTLVTGRDPARFAHAIDAILADASTRAHLAANAHASVRRFGWQRVAHDVATLYAEAQEATLVSVAD